MDVRSSPQPSPASSINKLPRAKAYQAANQFCSEKCASSRDIKLSEFPFPGTANGGVTPLRFVADWCFDGGAYTVRLLL